MNPEVEILYLEMLEYIPEDYEKLLYLMFSSKSSTQLRNFLRCLGPEDRHTTKVFQTLLGHIELDYISKPNLAKQLLKDYI